MVNINDPPLWVSANVTVVPEEQAVGTVVYTFVTSDEDNDTVSCFIVAGNVNTGSGELDVDGRPFPAFTLQADSCALSVVSRINYEQGPRSYNLMVRLYDGHVNTIVILTIIIAGVCLFARACKFRDVCAAECFACVTLPGRC